MRRHRSERAPDAGRSAARRAPAVAIGALFVVLGGAILYLVERANVAGLLCGAVVLLLGVEALIAAARRRDPLLSKIGPLP